MKIPATLALAAAALLALGLATRASAYEEPAYEVVSQEGDFEVRRYAPYLVAETVVDGDFESSSSEAFMRLFRYISGKNRRQVRPADPKIAMTIPVTMQQRGAEMRMTFMVPSRFSLETAPPPADPAVVLREEPGGLVAAYRYGGRSTQERFLERRGLLLDWAERQGLEASGEPLFAQYNGPFTPWFMRRNEVLLPLAEGSGE